MTARPRKSGAGPGVVVREARWADLPALLEIYNDAVLNVPATYDSERLTLAQRIKRFLEHGRLHPLVVAESQGRVVGYASRSPFMDKPGYQVR
jgi:L-amino acid N-acyltransferase